MLDVCQVRQTPLMSNYVQKYRTFRVIEKPSNIVDYYIRIRGTTNATSSGVHNMTK